MVFSAHLILMNIFQAVLSTFDSVLFWLLWYFLSFKIHLFQVLSFYFQSFKMKR